MGQVTRGSWGNGSGVTIEERLEVLVRIQLRSRPRVIEEHHRDWMFDWKDHCWGHVVVTMIASHKAGHHMIGKMKFQKGHDSMIITQSLVQQALQQCWQRLRWLISVKLVVVILPVVCAAEW